jgi:hypothetical protein
MSNRAKQAKGYENLYRAGQVADCRNISMADYRLSKLLNLQASNEKKI